MTHYRLKIPSFTQYKFAWAELPARANISDDFPRCPNCGRAIGMRYWLPPYEIIIKQPKNIGDFVGGIIATNLIVSENFKNKYELANLTGIEKFNELNIVQVGSKKNDSHTPPKLFGVTVKITNTQADYDKMDVKWSSNPQKGACKLCCPGGGGVGGIYQSYEKIVFKQGSLTSYDFFIAINFAGNIIVTEKAKDFIYSNNFTNVQLTPVAAAKHDIFKVN